MRRSKAAITLSAGLAAAVLTPWGCSRVEKRPAKDTDAVTQAPEHAADAERVDAKATGSGEAPKPVSQPETAKVGTPDAAVARKKPRPRLLWEMRIWRSQDRFEQIFAAGGKLLGLRKGVLWAFDGETGKLLWRLPKQGHAVEPFTSGRDRFVIGVLGDTVVTRMSIDRGEPCKGIMAVRLSDGKVLREVVSGLGGKRGEIQLSLTGKELAFWGRSDDGKSTLVEVVDLERRRVAADFTLDGAAENLHANRGRVHGVLKREDGGFARAFTVDLEAKRIYTVPLRRRYNYQPVSTLLPDGSRIFLEGRFSATCAYQRPIRWSSGCRLAGKLFYDRDRLGLYCVDTSTGRELWRLPLSYRGCGDPSYKIASGGDMLAMAERNHLYVLDAETGRPLAVIRMSESGELEDTYYASYRRLACDGERAYFAWPGGLKVFSVHPVDPDRPDGEDPGDPAYTIRRTREALVKGDYEDALTAILGIGSQVRVCPAVREEAAELLSQLARSPVPVQYPERWTEVMCAEGWVAGELFLEDFKNKVAGEGAAEGQGVVELVRERAAAVALLAVGTERALRAATEIIGRPDADWVLLTFAAEAERRLSGKLPLESILKTCRKEGHYAVLEACVEPERFRRLAPQLRRRRYSDLVPRDHLPPDVLVTLLDHPRYSRDRKAMVALEAARLQVLSQERGRGEEKAIEIHVPSAGGTEATEEF